MRKIVAVNKEEDFDEDEVAHAVYVLERSWVLALIDRLKLKNAQITQRYSYETFTAT